MDRHFQCVIQYNQHKYDIVINEDISSVCFENIYQKIQQIIRLALNEDIDFDSHVFEIFENNSSNGLIVQSFNHFVKHLSLIRIFRNQVITPSICFNNPFDTYFQFIPHQIYTPLVTPNTVQTNPVVDGRGDKEFVPHEYYCDICPELVDKQLIDSKLLKVKLNLNFESYKRYSDLLRTITEVSNSSCDLITEYEWINIIPFKMRAFGYKSFSPKLWKNSYELFVKKYIEVMNESPDRYVACSLFPFFHEYNGFRFHSSKDRDLYQEITDLRQKMNRSVDRKRSSDNTNGLSRKERKKVRRLEKRLSEEKEDIKVFHLIIQLIHPKSSYRKNSNSKWEKISHILRRTYGYSSRRYSSHRCRDFFNEWSLFYAQNYDRLNGNLEPELQKIFDLFKIIHILDLNLFWSTRSSSYSLLRKISHKLEIKDYLNDLENRKLVFKHRRRSTDSDSSSERKECLKTKEIDLKETKKEDKSVAKNFNLMNDSNTNVVIEAQTSNSGRLLPITVSNSDPRLSRQKTIYSMNNSNPKPIPSENSVENQSKNVPQMNSDVESDRCLTVVPMDLEDLEEGEIKDNNSCDNNPVINTIIRKEMKSLVVVPRDLPLNQQIINNTSHLGTTPKINVSFEKSFTHTKESTNSAVKCQTSRLSIPSKPSVCDPRLKSKIYNSIQMEKLVDTPLNNNKTNEVIKIQAFNELRVVAPTQPLNTLRDPRLKRKQQIEELVEGSNESMCSQNPLKRFKSESIQLL